MANEELKSFLEDRLKALDPSIDLDPGSPAQTQFIDPVLTYLGTDPFETDIEKFLNDRFAQEFPEIYAGEPSVVRDTFVNPLIVFLDPFKREIETIKRNQSLQDPTVLSDEDADALAANFFEERDPGNFSSGSVRVFFTNPTNQSIPISTRFFTTSGLNFYPTVPITITAEEMVFNQDGSLFYMDVPVKAESEGSDYNVSEGDISGVEGLFGPVKVTNVQALSTGATKIDTPSFIENTKQSLTERSLVTRRGATARILELFQTEVKAVQVIGAGDEEMERDIIVAASPGHAWLTGTIGLYDEIAYARIRTIEGEESDSPIAGDTLYVYLDKTSYPGVSQSERLVRLTVEEVLFGPLTDSSPYQVVYLVRFSGSFPTGVVVSGGVELEGGFSKKGTVRISSLPDIGAVSFSVPNGTIHVFGHTDIYVRPTLQPISTAVWAGLTDSDSIVEKIGLITEGGGLNKNKVTDNTIDFVSAGVEINDLLVIETGTDAGIYLIAKVSPTYLYLTDDLTVSEFGLRYRIVKKIRVETFEPKIPKFPFGSAIANDLETTIGSNLFKLATNDVISYGAAVGDIVRISTGIDEGDFTITGFDPVLGGRGIIVDRNAAATAANLSYSVFTSLEAIDRPLVRIKEILLLDSSRQSTGIAIPYADPVAVSPTAAFTSARVRGSSARKSGYVIPDITRLISLNPGDVAAASGDRRYSLGFDPPEGTYKAVQFDNLDLAEFSFRNDAQGKCSYFLATAEYFDEPENFPPVDPHPGECLTIKSGPNAGSYLIDSVVKFKHKLIDGKIVWNYFIKIYGRFPVDIFKSIVDFLATTTVPLGLTLPDPIPWPGFWSTWYSNLASKISAAITEKGGTPPSVSVIQSTLDAQSQVDFEWGDPARGVLRSYFTSPTIFEQKTGESDSPTLYKYTSDTGSVIYFRPDPLRYTKYQIIPSRLDSDTDVIDYPRDLDASVDAQATFTDTTNPTVFQSGVIPGMTLAVHEEVFLHGNKYKRSAVRSQYGSTQITAPTASGNIFTSDMVGNLIFIDQGDDEGGYRITGFIDGKNILLDKALTITTPVILLQGSGAQYGYDGGITKNKLVASSAVFTNSHIDKFITIYGSRYDYQGSYKIKSLLAASPSASIEVERSGNFPAYPTTLPIGGTDFAYWVVTDAPPTTPSVVGNGTELYGLQPIRVYESVAEELIIYTVEDLLSISRVSIPSGLRDGIDQPYRIFASNIRRITPDEMKVNIEGPFTYFDTEVVSLEPQSSSNIAKETFLSIEEGTYKSTGYRFDVLDHTLTYSTKEVGYIDLPARILPIGSEDAPYNFLNLTNAVIQISYEKSAAVSDVQDFIDSAEDRITSANMLARHFLPTYVSYDAIYSGGSSTDVVSTDIITYIDNIPVETALDISKLEEAIINRGGNPETPTKAMVLIHDWDRKMWLEFSENEVGGGVIRVPMNGSSRVMYFIPGPDVSGIVPIPSGERINLTRM